MKDIFINQLNKELRQINIFITDIQAEQFFKYYQLLIQWNSIMNLTAITQQNEVVTKHFVDSLSLKRVIDDIGQRSSSLIDVGTGAGFPGIPLKIVFPKLDVTLLDSLNKRVKFLNEVINQLELKNIRAIHGRAEDLGHNNVSRETFDVAVSRAVANLSTLSEYCLPFVKKGGIFVSYKSGKIEEELDNGKKALKKLNGEIEDIVSFSLPNLDERCLVKVRKTGVVNKKYPRKAGLPSKEPLK